MKSLGITVIITILCFSGSLSAAPAGHYAYPQQIPAPSDNQPTPERIALGKQLFFDSRLSGANTMSCASCHVPALGWSDGRPTAAGNNGASLELATLSLINVAYNRLLKWDGSARSLEEHALGPIQSPEEMAQDLADLEAELRGDPEYTRLFEQAYPGLGISRITIAKALASFQRTLIARGSAFEQWQNGNEGVMSAEAKRGFALFEGKARCSICHSGFNFTDNGFHNIGLKDSHDSPHPGRFAIHPIGMNKGAFKTPTLHGIALTAPYMHNGIYSTLEEVVTHYDRGGDIDDSLSPSILPLGLSPEEKSDLVAFLRSLTPDDSVIIQKPIQGAALSDSEP